MAMSTIYKIINVINNLVSAFCNTTIRLLITSKFAYRLIACQGLNDNNNNGSNKSNGNTAIIDNYTRMIPTICFSHQRSNVR